MRVCNGDVFVSPARVLDRQAQRTVMELQDQLDLLKASGDAPTSDTEDVAELKVLPHNQSAYNSDVKVWG